MHHLPDLRARRISLNFFYEFTVYVDLLFIMAAQALAAGAPALAGKDHMDNHPFSLFMNAGVPVDQIDMIGDFGVTNVAMLTHPAMASRTRRACASS